ncbi:MULTISPECIES: ATP-binding protein [unclassified Phyllobacterium]|uniref:ATP-binding protein n=1 Tax=unclassified Phyllobacterium TaxID=2638441 RepID=UPI0030130FC6
MDINERIDRRAIVSYWAAAAFVIVIALIGAATLIRRDYQSRIDTASQNAMNLANALAEHTTQIFVKLDALSRAVMEDRSNPIVGANMLSEVMMRRAAAEPAATAIAIIDKAGKVAASSVLTYPVGKDMSGTTSFKMLSALDGPEYYISPPYRTEFGVRGDWSGWTMNYVRKIKGSDGAFDGFVLIIVDGPFLYGFYDRLQDQGGRAVGLVGKDGVVRASNATAVIGRDISAFAQSAIQNKGGVIIRPSVYTGMERIFAYSPSSAAPLLAYVGVSTVPIYKAWLASSIVIVVALFALLAALVALGVILGKYIRNRASLLNSTLDTARARQEREFLQTILNTGGALVAVTNSRGHFIVANPAFRAIFQLEDSNAYAEDINVLEYALGSNVHSVIDKLPYQTNRSVRSRNGENRELSWTVTSIRDNEGEVKNLVALGFDITERRAAELAIYQSGKMITLGEMATSIAHEINQPLATITMALDNLRERLKNGSAKPGFVNTSLQLISDQVERTAAIVSHMRIYGHRSDGNAYPLDPTQAIEGALSIAQTQFRDAGIELRKNYRAGEYQMLADLTLIEQIILNILLNAKDAILEKQAFAKDEAVEKWIEISLDEEPAEKMIVISISDSGPGIAPGVLDRLFEPFFTTKPIGSGTGLGLSLCYGMARDLGGRVEARNTASGAEFRVLMRVVV